MRRKALFVLSFLLVSLFVLGATTRTTTRNPKTELPSGMVETGINFWPPFGCSEETIPAGAILAPETGPLPGASVEITTTGVSDASGIEEVRFYFEYCPTVTPPTGCTGNRVLIGIDKSTPYAQTWTFPGCAYDNSKWTIHVAFEDVCGNVRFQFTDDLVLNGRGC